MACCGYMPPLETLADVVDRSPWLDSMAGYIKQYVCDKMVPNRGKIHLHGHDMPGIRDWNSEDKTGQSSDKTGPTSNV